MNDARRPLRFGILGATGYIGEPYRAELRQLAPHAQIVALAARREERLRRAAERDGARLATTEWHQVIADPEVDVVAVLTPDSLHHQQALAACAAGKHLFCEKPLGRTVAETEAIVAAVQTAGVASFVPFWNRFLPVILRARSLVSSGALGEIRIVAGRWYASLPVEMPFTWRMDAAVSAAGSVADIGTHAVDLVRWVCGLDVQQVLAHHTILAPPRADAGELDYTEAWALQREVATGGDRQEGSPPRRAPTAPDFGTLSWQLANGAVGTLTIAQTPAARGAGIDFEIHGTEASLLIDRAAGHLHLARSEPGTPKPRVTTETVAAAEPALNRFAEYVLPALYAQLEGTPFEYPSIEDGLYAQRFVDAVMRSAATATWATVAV